MICQTLMIMAITKEPRFQVILPRERLSSDSLLVDPLQVLRRKYRQYLNRNSEKKLLPNYQIFVK